MDSSALTNWITKEFNLSKFEGFSELYRGNGALVWTYIIKHVKSRETVKRIKANLKIEKYCNNLKTSNIKSIPTSTDHQLSKEVKHLSLKNVRAIDNIDKLKNNLTVKEKERNLLKKRRKELHHRFSLLQFYQIDLEKKCEAYQRNAEILKAMLDCYLFRQKNICHQPSLISLKTENETFIKSKSFLVVFECCNCIRQLWCLESRDEKSSKSYDSQCELWRKVKLVYEEYSPLVIQDALIGYSKHSISEFEASTYRPFLKNNNDNWKHGILNIKKAIEASHLKHVHLFIDTKENNLKKLKNEKEGERLFELLQNQLKAQQLSPSVMERLNYSLETGMLVCQFTNALNVLKSETEILKVKSNQLDLLNQNLRFIIYELQQEFANKESRDILISEAFDLREDDHEIESLQNNFSNQLNDLTTRKNVFLSAHSELNTLLEQEFDKLKTVQYLPRFTNIGNKLRQVSTLLIHFNEAVFENFPLEKLISSLSFNHFHAPDVILKTVMKFKNDTNFWKYIHENLKQSIECLNEKNDKLASNKEFSVEAKKRIEEAEFHLSAIAKLLDERNKSPNLMDFINDWNLQPGLYAMKNLKIEGKTVEQVVNICEAVYNDSTEAKKGRNLLS